MSRPKIKTARIGVLLFIGIIVGGFAAHSLDGLRTTNNFATELAGNWMPSLNYARRMERDLADLRLVYSAQPASSPARRLVGRVASASTGNAAAKETWEEF